MRFLFGLGFGALTTLSVALLADWPPTPTPVPGEPIVVMPTEPAPELESPFAEAATTKPEVSPPARAPATEPKPKSEPKRAAVAVVEEGSATEPPAVAGVASADPAPTAEVEASWIPAPEPIALPPGEPLASEPLASEPLASEPLASEPLGGNPTAAVPAEPGQMSVWRPFHSQLSAEGFARRLSLQLGYPFEVVKVDAAKYHVVFAYADAVQRDTLSAQVTALTGFKPR